MNHNFLAFDLGATSGRAVLAVFTDGKFTTKEIYRFKSGIIEVGGKYYWNVYDIFNHLKAALREVARLGIPLSSIGVDTWGVDFGCIASDGTLLGLPRAYRDPYTSGIPEEVFGIIPREELYGITGIQIMDFNSIFQLYAQKKENFAPLLHAEEILFMPDLLAYMLTGQRVCEYTDASTSGLMNQRTGQFEKSLLPRLGLDPSILREVVRPGTKAGVLRKSIAEETGVGQVPVIAVAGHDTASAIAAVPATDSNFAYLSSGTWSLMGIETEAPIISELSCEKNFTNEGGIEGTTRFLKNITGMWLLEQCRKVWAASGRDYDYSQIEQMALANKDFPSLVNPDDARFANPGNMPEAIAAYLADTGQRVPSDDGEFVSCIYHSLTARYREVLSMLMGFAPFKIETLHIIGGGAANATMNQMTADAIGLPVLAGPMEATAIGNVMMQAKAAGLVKDRWEMRRAIAESFPPVRYEPEQKNI